MSELREKLLERQKTLKGGGGSKGLIFLKEGTLRVRILPHDKDKDFAMEVTYFYLGGDVKGVISPATLGEPCAIMEAYNKLKASKNEKDRDIAKLLKPKRRWAIPHIQYKDVKGGEVDAETGARIILLTNNLYDNIIELYVDDADHGDFTKKKTGYDLKYKRVGTGQFDTEYKVLACAPSPIDPDFKGPYDVEEMLRDIIPTYEDTQQMVLTVLGGKPEGKETPKKKKPAEDDEDDE